MKTPKQRCRSYPCVFFPCRDSCVLDKVGTISLSGKRVNGWSVFIYNPWLPEVGSIRWYFNYTHQLLVNTDSHVLNNTATPWLSAYWCVDISVSSCTWSISDDYISLLPVCRILTLHHVHCWVACTILGLQPPNTFFLNPKPSLWTPNSAKGALRTLTSWGVHNSWMISHVRYVFLSPWFLTWPNLKHGTWATWEFLIKVTWFMQFYATLLLIAWLNRSPIDREVGLVCVHRYSE